MSEFGSMLAEIIATDYEGDEVVISEVKTANELLAHLQAFYRSDCAKQRWLYIKPLHINMDMPVKFLEYCLTIEPEYPLY